MWKTALPSRRTLRGCSLHCLDQTTSCTTRGSVLPEIVMALTPSDRLKRLRPDSSLPSGRLFPPMVAATCAVVFSLDAHKSVTEPGFSGSGQERLVPFATLAMVARSPSLRAAKVLSEFAVFSLSLRILRASRAGCHGLCCALGRRWLCPHFWRRKRNRRSWREGFSIRDRHCWLRG